jgi:hypothetical protein
MLASLESGATMPMKTRVPQRSDDGNAFMPESDQRTGTRDELAEHLAEEHQRAVTTGESNDDDVEDTLAEEMGGSYILSGAEAEFGDTATEPNVAPDVERNPLPQAVGPLAIASLEEGRDAVEALEEQTGDADLPDPEAEEASRMVPEPPEVRPTTKHSAAR